MDFSSLSTKDLLQQRADRWNEACAILSLAKAESRSTSDGENERYDALTAAVNQLDEVVASRRETQKRLDSHKAMAERLNESAGRQSQQAFSLAEKSQEDLQVWMGQKQIDLNSAEAGRCNPDVVGKFDRLRSLATEEYRNSFAQFVGTGQQSLGLQIGIASKGGFLAPTTMVNQMIIFLSDLVFVRQLASKFSLPNAVSMGAVSWDTDPGDGDWTQEVPATDLSEDTNAAFGKRELYPNLLTKLIKISQQLLNVSIVDIEAFILTRLAYKFGITEEKAFMTGTGDKQPLGLFTVSPSIPVTRDVTAASATTLTFDDLILLKGSTKYQYQKNGVFLLSRDAINKLRQIKVTTSYAWQPALTLGNPDMILGNSYYMSEYVPNTFTTGQYVAMFGDLSFYWIADSLEMQVQRLIELFSLRNQIGVKAMKATDAMPVLAEAFARLKLA